MRYNYDSFDYWDELISKNKTIRGHMFMDTLPTEGSIYIHTLLFFKNNGLNNIWSYFPDLKSLLGYIQYSFLQEAFYKWIYGKERMVINIPNISVEKIIKDARANNKITKEEANNMIKHLEMIKSYWNLPNKELLRQLKKFSREFNRTWYGDNKEFLYLKIFESAKELGDFVLNSSYMTLSEEDFKIKTGITVDEWEEVCLDVGKNEINAKKFRDVLLKSLTEII